MNKINKYIRIAELINRFYKEEYKEKRIELFDMILANNIYYNEYELVKHLDNIEKKINKSNLSIKLNKDAKNEFKAWVFFSFRIQYEYGY